jgi:hypothetical protein
MRKDLELAIESIPRLWVRGNVLVLLAILVETLRKILWFAGLIRIDTLNNLFIGTSLFLSMVAGLDLLRTYVYISWANDLAFEFSLLEYSKETIAGINATPIKAQYIRPKNLMEGILLTSLTFLLWASIPIGISKIKKSLRKLGITDDLNTGICYITLVFGCKTRLENILGELLTRLDSITSNIPEIPLE